MKKIITLITGSFLVVMAEAQTLQTVTTTGNTTSNALRLTGEANIGVSGNPELVLGFLSTPRTNDTRAFIGWKGDAATNTTTNGQAGTLLLQGRTNLADMSIDFATGFTTASLRMRIAGNGNVSIGDNSLIPGARLLIKGSGATNATTSLLIQNSAAAEVLRVLDNGNVGINMVAPSEKLHIQNGNLLVASTTGLGTLMGSLRFAQSGTPAAYAGIAGQLNLAGTDQVDLLFYTAFGTASEKMRIMSNSGYVGIGTATPSSKVDIVGTGGVNVDFQTTGRARIKGSSPGLSIHDGTGERSFLGWAGSGIPTQALGLYIPTTGWNTLNVLQNGSVAIGAQTTNTNSKLDVTGGDIYANGRVLIGLSGISAVDYTSQITNNNYSLAVNGTAVFTRARVKSYGGPGTSWADYVFEEKYNLLPLEQLDDYIKIHKHLPEVPTAEEAEKNGIDLGDNQAVLLKKIEELTLYIIDQNKQNAEQQQQINTLIKKVEELKAKVKQ